MAGLSPMMSQYMEIKSRNTDSILFFRLGDFYEMFFDDAKTASEELDLTLTGRDCGLEERAPMCGVPFHSCESYIARLVEKGYKVAICEQMEDPSTAKGIVKRDVVRIITPGTVIEESMLEEDKNNYLASLYFTKESVALCFADVSTGKAYLTELKGNGLQQQTINQLARFAPSEIITTRQIELSPEITDYLNNMTECMVTIREDSAFSVEPCEELVKNHFEVISPENLGIESNSAAVCALGAALKYIYETGGNKSISIGEVAYYSVLEYMNVDYTAVRNLELCETMRSKSKKGSLLWVLDKTKTAMGKRMLRSFIEQPLLDIFAIEERLNAVEELTLDPVLRGELMEYLTGIRDLERLLTRIVYRTANAKDLNTVADTCSRFPFIKSALSTARSKQLINLYNKLDPMEDVVNLIRTAIDENPPAIIREGGMFKKGYNAELDELIYIIENGANIVTDIENRERERTGIKNLRVRFNKVFGYYIEVTNSYKELIPEDYIRKQTLTNCERFITEELKNLESRIIGAKDRRERLEYEMFEDMLTVLADQLKRFQTTAEIIAIIDGYCSLADTAVKNDYVRPRLNTDGVINIRAGRHPVVERVIKTPFVSNDTYLDLKDDRCAVITGPNMAGKSTYMRQVALITLMAQIGSFVPAESANISIVDAIYTRVGASDDLASGQSTFMVEMSEVASILKNATSRSLLILDEIGRGTSTFDGMSIARAVLEFVADKKKLGAKTLFATHYHELTEMENELKGIRNYNIAVKKRGDDITFLRRIVRGGADDSYGIEVAKLAGIPDGVIKRAKEILQKTLEEGVTVTRTVKTEEAQMPLVFGKSDEIIEDLKQMDVNVLTPIECMSLLSDLSKKAKEL
ncbi:MAG: DNA mismatch repair protein MutS [Ruminococcaceae bacterium]|nr:DNA mismatch repair protein MutS [Oscillospiraceae bacterium]